MNQQQDDDASLDRLADFNKACIVATEDCMQDQFVILGSTSTRQHADEEDEYVYYETVIWEQQQQGPYDSYHDHHHYILGDMTMKGIVFLFVLAISLSVCAFYMYKFHNHQMNNNNNNNNSHVDPALQQATATAETTASSTATTVKSTKTKKKPNINNDKESSASSPLQQQQQQQQDMSDNDDNAVPDLVGEDSSNKNINNKNSKKSAARRRSKRIQERQSLNPQHQQAQQQPQHQHPVITAERQSLKPQHQKEQQQQQQQQYPVMTKVVGVSRTTEPTSSQLATAIHPDVEIALKAADKVLAVRQHLQERTGETLSLDKVLEQSLDQSRHEEKMQYKMQAELRHYEFEASREQFKNNATQARHDENMAVQNQDDLWLTKLKTCRNELLQTLLQEFWYTLYAFFVAHVVWHFVRLRQIWTFTGIMSALYYSLCGGPSCTHTTPDDDLLAFQYLEALPSSSPSYFSSLTSGYLSTYFPSSLSSWSTFSILEFVAPTWLLQDLQCTGICGVKIILGVFGMIVTAMIVPAWMAKYMATGVVAITMISNVFEWVPFMFGWEYMAGIYFCLGLGCYYYVEHECDKSQRVLQQAIGGTPSKPQVTSEEKKLAKVKMALEKHKLVLLGLAVVCFYYSNLELQRSQQFA